MIMPMASLNVQTTAISLYYDSGMCFEVSACTDQYKRVHHFAVAFNIDPVEVSLCVNQ